MPIAPQSSPEELVYAAAIVVLSNELYPRKLEIVREYIQNASDAIDSFARIAEHIHDTTDLRIKVSIQGKSLLIWDNGIGMDATEINKLKRIAYSEKKVGDGAGYKGIGRLAGIAVAKRLIISSTSYGDPKLHKFEFCAGDFLHDIAEKRRDGLQEAASVVINRHTIITELDVAPEEHYTMVELRDIADDHPQLLDPAQLHEYIGDIAPVGFAPDFPYGERIAAKLFEYVPDYSPKTVWLATTTGDRFQVYKPYKGSMMLAEPEFIPVTDNHHHLLAYSWYSTKGKEMLGKIRPSGGKFAVDGTTPAIKKRFAGLVYKLFGFSIGDRSLPLNTLWKEKDYTRALWFTGEIHIVDKNIKPTTDRSDFFENDQRNRLYTAGEVCISKPLNSKAQLISTSRQAHDRAEKHLQRFKNLEKEISEGRIDITELKARKEDLHVALEKELKVGASKDNDINAFVKETAQFGRLLQQRLGEAKPKKESKGELADLARELGMTSQARKVYSIIIETIEHYLREDKDSYYELSGLIRDAIKSKY